jgi:regulator of chromosome condensation (RCC1) repeat-containing protein/Regulator of Chromosome Condensation (RCC1) repeat protein
MRFTTPRAGGRSARILLTAGLVAGVLTIGAPSANAVNVSSVSAGAVHACVRTAAGAALCWGYNDIGMVGDGTRIDRRSPVQVTGLGSNVADVQAVWDHSCALTNGGSVKCWGHNGDGELGDGTLIRRLEPVQVTGLNSGVQQISLGFDSGCALLNTGAIRCWGYNGNGQLGDGTRTTRKTSVKVDNISDAVQISAGWDHTCAVLSGGGLQCWGGNDHGEIGDGTKHDRLKAVDVPGLTSGVAAVSAGFDHTCALLNTGSVKCWGNNKTGELGNGNTTNQLSPVDVAGLSNVDSISAGANHTCVVTSTGGAKCWGANESGELGDGTTKMRTSPVNVVRATSGVRSISAGGYPRAGMTCLNTNTGAVRCFGANHGVHGLEPIDSSGGQLGDGTNTDRLIPITVRRLGGNNPPNFRPDGLIGKTATTGFVGNDIYNKTGKKQTRTKTIAPGGTKKFFIHVQNDANVTDSFFVVAGGTGGGFTIDYSSGGKSVKGKVVSGLYWFTLSAGQDKTIVMTVKADGGIGPNAKRKIKVITRSAGDSAKLDVVKAVVHT